MKVCSAYGAGFYYLPGTDTCLRMGGYVFGEYEYNNVGNQVSIIPGSLSAGLVHDRGATDVSSRTRAQLIADARTNTSLGTLRAYLSAGFIITTPGIGPASGNAQGFFGDRAFLQLAGWTVGFAGSFFDFSPGNSMITMHSYSVKWGTLFAYTAQFGNGLSATVSVEDGAMRRSAIQAAAGIVGGAAVVTTNALMTTYFAQNLYGGVAVPDFIGNLRVDQAWGSAQISGLLHQVRINEVVRVNFPAASDTWGWAALGGIEVKTPTIAPGDSFLLQGAWSTGVVEAVGVSANPLTNNTSLGYRTGLVTNTAGAFNDAVGPAFDLFDAYVNAAGVQLTTAWSVNAQFRHFWTPTTRSAIFAGYTRIEVPAAATAVGHSDNTIWQLGANTVWSPVRDFDLGVEVMWTQLTTSCPLAGGCAPVAGAVFNTANIAGKTENVVSALVRARRNW